MALTWWPWLLYRILCLFGLLAVSLFFPCGCGNQLPPLLIDRDVVVDGDLTVRGDTIVEGSLDVDNDIMVDGSLDVTEDVTVTGDVVVIDDLVVGDDVLVDDDIFAGGDVTDNVPLPIDDGDEKDDPLPPPPPPPPIDDEVMILTATLYSTNGHDEFMIGEDVKMTVQVADGESPYDLRCLWPDAQFTIINDSNVNQFEISRQIAIPGTGTINCQITDSDGQIASVWSAITVK